jgi:flagellar biosynthesis GTPase FlhF
MLKNELIDEIRGSDTKAPMAFYGYPGSGRACAIASIIGNLNVIEKSTIEIICADDWTLGKNEQLRTLSNILGCSFRKMQLSEISIDRHRKTFIYLPYDLTSCNQLFDHNTYRKFLVLDCSRKFSINVDLINQVGISRIDGIILSRIDSLENYSELIEFIYKKNLNIVFCVWGNKLGIDCGFELPRLHQIGNSPDKARYMSK